MPLDLPSVQTLLYRHLLEDGEVEITSRLFAALDNDLERVEFATKYLAKYNFFDDLVDKIKDDSESIKFRKLGNQLFALKKDRQAFENYNLSIAYAVPGSETLGIAFANRSAVLLERKFYSKCIKDIDLALANNYPKNLTDKLEKRRQKCLNLMGNDCNERYYLNIQGINFPKHEKFECASDCIEFKYSNDLGRHLTATKLIKPGDVIAIEKPFIAVLQKDYYLTHCHNCLEESHNLIPCLVCPLVFFCSKSCREKSWDSFHRFECRMLPTLHAMDFTKVQLLALRTVIVARNEIGKCPDRYECDDVYKSERYNEIHNLLTNVDVRSNADLHRRSVVAAISCHLLELSGFLEVIGNDKKSIVGSLLLRHLQTAPSNMHDICELRVVNEVHENETEPTPSCNLIEIGGGAYSFLSLLNHSCDPNVVRHCHGTTIILRAMSYVHPGQELLDNYGYHFAVMNRADRQSNLREQYFFTCRCVACVQDWPLHENLPETDESLPVTDQEMCALQESNRNVARGVLSNMLGETTSLTHVPSKNRSEYQEIMKQCFAIFGNRQLKF